MTKIEEQQTNGAFKPTIHKHESFVLRKGWLHKGIRRVKEDSRLFTRSSDDVNKACDILGIGVNMVKALRYWMNATNIMREDGKKQQYISELGDIIHKYDPYFEERGTNYIIHYMLVSNKEAATAWYWFFNEHRGTTIDKMQFVDEFSEFCRINCNEDSTPAQKVLESEFNCLIRTYYGREDESDNFDPEETKVCPLTELRLITLAEKKHGQERIENIYKKTMPDKDDIHPLIAYAVISQKQAVLQADEVQISELLNGENNIGKVFNLDRSTVFYLIEKMERLGLIKITRTAGLDVIRIKREMNFIDCITEYYHTLGGEAQND